MVLNIFFFSFSDDDSNHTLINSSMRKDNFENIQVEHRKILETIENALQKLNLVRFSTRISPDL